jgi:hypothetical protein
MQSKKTIIFISIFTVVVLLVLSWYVSRPQGSLEFALAPQSVQLTIDKKVQTITHKQILKLTPGTYEATFSAEGFESLSDTLIVEDNKTKRTVLALTPITEAAKKQLADNAESQIVIKEYEQVKFKRLTESLPLSGVNYAIESCPSLKQPGSDTKALCIIADTPEGETAAKNNIRTLGFDPDTLEVMTGSENIKILFAKPNYKIEHYTNTKPEAGTGKTALFITPLNTPFIPLTTTFDAQLEDIRTAALKDLTTNGYQLDNYDIFYANFYLSKYSPGHDAPVEHAFPPSYE